MIEEAGVALDARTNIAANVRDYRTSVPKLFAAGDMALSLRRANTVKDALVRDGVPATAISVIGKGETQPLVPTADGVREPQNRRVEIVLQ